jgi:hypothetical protein
VLCFVSSVHDFYAQYAQALRQHNATLAYGTAAAERLQLTMSSHLLSLHVHSSSSGGGGSKQAAAPEKLCWDNEQLHDQLGLLQMIKAHAMVRVLQVCLHTLLLTKRHFQACPYISSRDTNLENDAKQHTGSTMYPISFLAPCRHPASSSIGCTVQEVS